MSVDQTIQCGQLSSYVALHSEIADALAQGKAIVLIESAVISPAGKFPVNTELYHAASAAIRRRGAIPALVAVMAGKIRIGLSPIELERLACATDVIKLARRDLAMALAQDLIGSTTVSSALFCATLAGLPIVITGAIGGVHRGYETTMDASADLETLADTRAAVVCGGAKIILDIPRTLEYLETKGVPVLGYRTGHFPAYFTTTTLPVDAQLDKAELVAEVMKLHWGLNQQTGLVIAVPPPDDAIDADRIEAHVAEALAAAARDRISGKAITPYMLRHLEAATGGLSARIQRQVVVGVAEAAADIAVAYSRSQQSSAAQPLRVIR